MSYSLEELQHALHQHYRVERELGAGGMATVYLAHDLKHERQVAIKVLRPELAAIVGGERFLKEIRLTANLQHPHILPLHDSGESDGVVFYVMPYVEGESLRDRLSREKQLPVDEAVRIAREVASGLDYAHRRGVVHRDIKPENILLHDGQALVADFGIALAMTTAGAGNRLTETGMSLGTPHYMAPEQAMGEREITPKADVYALGCVLYEMLVGEPPFTGPTAQAIIARVVTEEPRPITIQRRTVPPPVADAVVKSLSKLPADRFATAAQFAEALAMTAAAPALPATPSANPRMAVHRRVNRRTVATGVAGLVLLLTGAGVSQLVRPAPTVPLPARFSIAIPEDKRITGAGFGAVAISPDGQAIVFVGATPQGTQLFLRRLDELTVRPLSGTEGGASPQFSHDGTSLFFVVGNSIRRVSAAGGTAVTIASAGPTPFVLQGRDGSVFISDSTGAIVRSDGRSATVIVRRDSAAGESALYALQELPNGSLLVLAQTQGVTGRILEVAPSNGKRSVVTRTLAAHAAWSDGQLAVMIPNGTLVALPWAPGQPEATGSGEVLATDVRASPGAAPQIAFSSRGSLIYMPAQPSELVLADRAGRVTPVGIAPRRFHHPRISPDGRRIAVDITDDVRDVWQLDRADNTLTRLTFTRDAHDPMWLPDGRSITYASARSNSVGIYRTRVSATGASDSILHDGQQLSAHAVTPDGRALFAVRYAGATAADIVRIPLDGTPRAEPVVATPFTESFPAIARDGAWLAYVSDESGIPEVYVRSVNGDARVIVSQGGGSEPVWSRTSNELFYRDVRTTRLVAASLDLGPDPRVTRRTPLFDAGDFEIANPHANYDVAPDGRFVFVRQVRASEVIYLQDWPALARRAAQAR